MNIFQEALNSNRSTIVFGDLGRHPTTVKFYLDSFPNLISVSEYEPIYQYRPHPYASRLLHVSLEPDFDEIIPSNSWNLVFTSHLHLSWNPYTTRVVKSQRNREHLCNLSQPVDSSSSGDHTVFVPPTSHVWPFTKTFRPEEEEERIRLDLSSVENCHEAYLKLLTFLDLCPQQQQTMQWSLSIKEQLRRDLIEKLMPSKTLDTDILLQILEGRPMKREKKNVISNSLNNLKRTSCGRL